MEDVSEQRVALLVTTLSSLLTPMMGSAVNIAMPAIARDFSMDAVLLSWVASSYLLAAAIFLLPFGRLADIVGRKKIFVIRDRYFQQRCASGRFGSAGECFPFRPPGTGYRRGHDIWNRHRHIDFGLSAPAARLGSGHQCGRHLHGIVAGTVRRRPADPIFRLALCIFAECSAGSADPGCGLVENAPGMGRIPW